jgi:hypothetical protein
MLNIKILNLLIEVPVELIEMYFNLPLFYLGQSGFLR